MLFIYLFIYCHRHQSTETKQKDPAYFSVGLKTVLCVVLFCFGLNCGLKMTAENKSVLC